jgi:two-component sensor histidine kinase
LDWIGQVSGDLLLIASELVTNVVLYSGCSSQDMISVRLDRAPGHVLLSISDPGARSAAQALAAQRSPDDIGLWVVDRLARRWGTERIEGYRLWAELALSTSSADTDPPPHPG